MIRLLGAMLLASGVTTPVDARVCQTMRYICATEMPLDGYCECVVSHGVIEDGTVVERAPPSHPINAHPGGCGIAPHDAGCHPVR